MNKSNFNSLVIQRQQFDQKRQFNQSYLKKNPNYFSLLCRHGPLPQKYHHNTDIFCLIFYLILLISMIVLICINGLTAQNFTYQRQKQLKTDIFYGSRFFLWQIVFSALALMVLSFIMTLLALYIPKIMSIFSIIFLLAICILFTFIQIKRFFKHERKVFLYLWKGLITLIATVFILIIIIRRRQKISNLGLFLELPSKVIKSHMCAIFSQLILLSLVQILIWYAFVNCYYSVSTVTVIKHPVLHFLTKLIVVIIWLWTSGIFIAISDYMTVNYTVHWFYNLSKSQILQNISNENPLPLPTYNQQKRQSIPLSQNKFRTGTFGPLYKKLCSQIGTVIFGAILAYLPLYLIAKIQKILFKSSSKQIGLATFSKYGYLDTVMQWQSFISANQRTYQLRKRIKSVMPQLYMLGHIYGDFTKLGLILIGLASIHELVQLKSDIAHHSEYLVQYSFTIFLFAIGLGLQIATNFTNLIGKCGDIVFFLYCIDLQIQRVHFSHNQYFSTPKVLWQTLRQLTIKRNWSPNNQN